jgi:hypothetical protein
LVCGALLLQALFQAGPIYPQEADNSLILSVETAPEDPQSGLPWIVTLLVDHPAPAQVQITLPELPPSLFLESIRTGGRILDRYDGSVPIRCTQVELRFIPLRAGPAALPPVMVSVPDDDAANSAAFSEWLRISVGGAAVSHYARLVWEGVPTALKLGEKAEFTLRMIPPSLDALPEFHPEVPENALLEEIPVSDAEKAGGAFLKLRLFPLNGPELSYHAQSLLWEGVKLEIPGWRIRVLPGEKKPLPPEEPRSTIESPRADKAPPPFPPFPDAAVFGASAGIYTKTLDEARRLWNNGSPAEALARLRQVERDSLTGWNLARPRRIAEDALGIGATEDERWKPRFLFFALAAGGFILPVLAILVFLLRHAWRKKSVTSRRPWGYRVVVAATLILLGAAMLLGIGNGRQRIARETGAYRMPELQEPVFIFREGEPVQIRSQAETWVYVESFDGRTGWVPQDKLISY